MKKILVFITIFIVSFSARSENIELLSPLSSNQFSFNLYDGAWKTTPIFQDIQSHSIIYLAQNKTTQTWVQIYTWKYNNFSFEQSVTNRVDWQKEYLVDPKVSVIKSKIVNGFPCKYLQFSGNYSKGPGTMNAIKFFYELPTEYVEISFFNQVSLDGELNMINTSSDTLKYLTKK